jgi:hypothetical protein
VTDAITLCQRNTRFHSSAAKRGWSLAAIFCTPSPAFSFVAYFLFSG